MVVSSWGPGLHSRVLSMMLSDNGEIYCLVVINSCASTMVEVCFAMGGLLHELKELKSACDFAGDVYWVEKGLLQLTERTSQAAGLFGFLWVCLLQRGAPSHPCAAVFSKGFEGQMYKVKVLVVMILKAKASLIVSSIFLLLGLSFVIGQSSCIFFLLNCIHPINFFCIYWSWGNPLFSF